MRFVSLTESIVMNGTLLIKSCARFVSSAKNLGVILDKELSFEVCVCACVRAGAGGGGGG